MQNREKKSHPGELIISTPSELDSYRQVASSECWDELLAFVESVDYHLNVRSFCLPIRGQFSVPDVILSGENMQIGLEVTRLEWQALSQKINTSNGSLVSVSQNLCVDKPLRKIRETAQHICPGWVNEEATENLLELVRIRIDKKTKKLASYHLIAKTSWLFLIDNHDVFQAWDRILRDNNYINRIKEIGANSGYDKILLYRWPNVSRKKCVTIIYPGLDTADD
jgi:hypothetical protein